MFVVSFCSVVFSLFVIHRPRLEIRVAFESTPMLGRETNAANETGHQQMTRDPQRKMMRAEKNQTETTPVTANKSAAITVAGSSQRHIYFFRFKSSKRMQIQVLDESASMYLSNTSTRSAYDIPGVDEDASAEDICRAYRQKARTAHPDKGGTTDDYVALKHAYDTLANPLLRRAHDSVPRKRKERGESSTVQDPRKRYSIDEATAAEVSAQKKMWAACKKAASGESSELSGRTIMSVYFEVRTAILTKKNTKKNRRNSFPRTPAVTSRS